jgi:nucleoid-associated protein YgaU
MFEPTSRYAQIENATMTKENGQVITYKKRRFLPDGEKMNLIQEITVSAGDRLDQIAAKVIGDPEQFWRICDANNAMYPPELTNTPGKILKISSKR